MKGLLANEDSFVVLCIDRDHSYMWSRTVVAGANGCPLRGRALLFSYHLTREP